MPSWVEAVREQDLWVHLERGIDDRHRQQCSFQIPNRGPKPCAGLRALSPEEGELAQLDGHFDSLSSVVQTGDVDIHVTDHPRLWVQRVAAVIEDTDATQSTGDSNPGTVEDRGRRLVDDAAGAVGGAASPLRAAVYRTRRKASQVAASRAPDGRGEAD